MSREESAAQAINESYRFPGSQWNELVKSSDRANRNRVKIDRGLAHTALAAADAHDAAHGIHRVSLDDATVERAAVVLYERNNPAGRWASHSARVKTPYRDAARAVLAAAVKEDGE